ncbi:MAG: glycosyltransferase, partial [Planctomycetes bacterium]|nr:glycosyltransferase [Planctomycetota bacterium]
MPLAAPPRRAKVLAVTVNYRTPDLALRALASLERERTQVGELRAVVVDNASGDGSAERIRGALDARGMGTWAILQESPTNGGFGAGNNLALRAALARPDPPDYFLLLNPDAALDPGALATLVEFLATHPRVGMAGPAT